MTEEPVPKRIKASATRHSFERNMTEVLFPSQPFDSRTPEYSLASADWFLPTTFTGSRLQGAESVKNAPAFPHTPPASSTSPQSRDEPFGHQQLPSSAFKGLDNSMSQGNNPFENLPPQSVTQPILSSNVRPSTSQQKHPPTPRSFAPIAPDPVGLQRMQAVRQSQEAEDSQQTKKRRLTQSSMEAPAPPLLKDEDKLLLQLKDEQQLPWKNIVSRFQQETGKVHAIAALQMRYKRLKDRLQVWTDPDVEALKQAHEYWESRKFDIISAKMLEFGATEKFSALACRRKWQELHPHGEGPYFQPMSVMPASGPATGFSQSASPQPAAHASAYTSMPSSTTYPHLPHPQSSMYGSMGSHSSVPTQSPMHSHSTYPAHTQASYGSQSYASYAPVTQPQHHYRHSPPPAGQPQPAQQTSYASPSPQQRMSSYSSTGGHGGQSQASQPSQGGYGWH